MYTGYGYGNEYGYGMDDGAMQMANMQSANLGLGAGFGLGAAIGSSPNTFMFMGNSLSLHSRLEFLSDEECSKVVDANISVSGTQLQPMNMMSYLCTIIWGSIVLFPLIFLCMDWWKRCTYPAFSIDTSIYQSMGRLMKCPNIGNMSLVVSDNTFDSHKANILYTHLTESRLKGFTFINMVGEYDYQHR